MKLPKITKAGLKVAWPYIAGSLGVVVVGVLVGWLIAGRGKSGSAVVPGAKLGTNEAGLADEKTFRDTATGILEAGGVNGEGTHHLTRDGGPSQNVYLTSTVIDLESFAGKKVQVWGETISARKAGWLMDVGKIKVVE
jgi:hypothetical protein